MAGVMSQEEYDIHCQGLIARGARILWESRAIANTDINEFCDADGIWLPGGRDAFKASVDAGWADYDRRRALPG